MKLIPIRIAACIGAVCCAAASAQTSNRALTPVTDRMLQRPAPADWLMWRGRYGAWGYSPLDQIDRRNAHELRLVWVRPLENTCATMTPAADPAAAGPYGLQTTNRITPGKRNVGVIEGISAETGKRLWKIEQRAATTSLLSTGGGLLFGGDVAGRFRAYDLRNGKVLWQVNLGAPVTGNPVSFAANGKQYIAVSTGTSPDATALLKLTPELHPGAGNNLFVFALR